MEQQTLSNAIGTFFNDLIETFQNDLSLDLLPSSFTGTDAIVSEIIADLEATRDALQNALSDPDLLSDLDPTDTVGRAERLASVLHLVGGVEATAEVEEVSLVFETIDYSTTTTAEAASDLGLSGLGLDIETTADLDVTTSLLFEQIFNVADETFSTSDDGSIQIDILGDLDYAASGTSGGLSLTVDEDTNVDEIDLDVVLDLATGDIAAGGGAVTTATASGGLNATISVDSDVLGVLPSIGADLAVGLNLAETDILGGALPDVTPSVTLQNVGLQSDQLQGLLDSVLGELLGIVDVFPIRQLRDLMAREIPVISAFTDIQTFQDLVEEWAENSPFAAPIFDFLDALEFVEDALTALQSLTEIATLNLGDITLDGAALEDLIAGGAVSLEALVPIIDAGDVIGSLLAENEALAPLLAPVDVDGLSFPALEGGARLLTQILFNGVEPDALAIPLIEYDLPPLAFEVSQDIAFNIFGPLAITIEGGFGAGVDFDIGYSTNGLFGEDPSFLDGFFIGAPSDDVGGYDPVAFTSLTLAAGLALDAGVVRAGVSGGLTGTLGIGLSGQDGMGRSHLGNLQLPCIFDDISGELEAFVKATLRLGFGPFSVEISRVLADFLIAQFNFDPVCGGPHGTNSPDIEVQDSLLAEATSPGSDVWRLNVGEDFAFRRQGDEDADLDGIDSSIDREVLPDGSVSTPAVTEVFRIGRPAPTPGGEPRPGIAIEAFGVTEIFGEELGETINTITADAGLGNDAIMARDDIEVAFSLDGGAGNDVLITSIMIDTVYGGQGDDSITGGAGNDFLFGGDHDDVLDGGEGADTLIGGDGQDQVSYEDSTEGVTLTPDAGGFAGSGGEAHGDFLSGIEVLIGSRQGDTFFGNPGQANIIEGNRGDDLIYGGDEDDLLVGGRGADVIYGGEGTDQTSYVLARRGVVVDLSDGSASGGHADGDQLFSIESVQGTFYADNLTSSGQDGGLDGSVGDDVLRSLGGAVDLFGGPGDDIVYADGDAEGGTLDGGGYQNIRPGRDLLSFRFSENAIEADLGAGTAGADTIIGGEFYDTNLGVPFDPSAGAPLSSFEDLEGSIHNDILTGDLRGNSISGLDGADIIYGGDGDDFIRGGLGADSLIGGAGLDWADYSDSDVGVEVALFGLSTGEGGTAEDDVLEEIENLHGSRFGDVLIGNDSDNRINPGIAIVGADIVYGGDGDDTLELRWQELNDAVALSYLLDDVTNEGFVIGPSDLTFFDVEAIDLEATAFNDIIIAQAFTDDRYLSLGGNDVIGAGGGRDVVLAGTGNDIISHLGRAREDSTELEFLWIDGGEDIDLLNIDLSLAAEAITLAMGTPLEEDPAQFLSLGDGTVAITRVEILGDVTTGAGNFDDTLIQLGDIDNNFSTGAGNDLIAPGLGFDTVDGGEAIEGATTDIDTLILDYSQAGAERVVSNFEIDQGDSFGVYGAVDGADNFIASIQFLNIERVLVTGTNGDDLMYGAEDPRHSGAGDLLIGLAGADTMYGLGSDDTLIAGVAGADDLIDVIYGGAGADLFVLGDETGYFYGEPSANAPSNRDGVFIQDFNIAEGDQLQLVGDASEYFTQETLGNTLLLRGEEGDPFIDAIFFGTTGLDLSASYVTYVQQALSATANTSQSASEPGEDLSATATEVQNLLNEFAPFLGAAGSTLPGADALLAQTLPSNAEVAQQIRTRDLEGPEIFQALRTASADPVKTETASAASAEQNDPLIIETTGFETSALSQLVRDQIAQAFNITDTGNNIIVGVDAFGNPMGRAELLQGFGTSDDNAVVISTGQAVRLAGPNALDGTTVPFQASGSSVPLEDLGNIVTSRIFRADVTGLDITEFSLIDAGTMTGFGSILTGVDIDAVFFSQEDISGDITAIDTISRLGVLDLSPAGVELELGPMRSGGPSGDELLGTFNGFFDNSLATLDVREPDVFLSGALSLGDAGRATFNLTDPIIGDTSENAPRTYLYIATGLVAPNGFHLDLAFDPEAVAPGTTADLSTDFGAPGAEGDLVGFDITIMLDDSSLTAGETLEVDLFQVIPAFESLLELAGPESQDRFRVRVNGVDVLQLSDGIEAQLENLALSPFGMFHPDLVQNLVGTGPMADVLRADAYTSPMNVRVPITVGEEMHIRIEVEDRGDGLLDTALFVTAPASQQQQTGAIAVFDEPDDALPSGLYPFLERALDEANSGALIDIGTDVTPPDPEDGPLEASVRWDDLTINAPNSFAGTLILEDTVHDLILQGDGALNLIGNEQTNILTGNRGSNSLDGGAGDDSLFGGDGDDALVGGAGADSIDGGAGTDDTADYSDSSARIAVFLNGSAGISGDAQGDTLINIENLIGTNFNDFLGGSAGSNSLGGGDSQDILDGQDGAVADTLNGGAGIDTAYYFGATGNQVLDMSDHTSLANNQGEHTNDTWISIEGFFGANGFTNDLTGDHLANYLLGGSLGDTISGLDGADHLYGLAGNDMIIGGNGNDVLLPGAGTDTVTGGADLDIFYILQGNETDIITDWTEADDFFFFFQVTGVGAYADLTFTDIGTDVRISSATNTSFEIIVQNRELTDLDDQTHFVFG